MKITIVKKGSSDQQNNPRSCPWVIETPEETRK